MEYDIIAPKERNTTSHARTGAVGFAGLGKIVSTEWSICKTVDDHLTRAAMNDTHMKEDVEPSTVNLCSFEDWTAGAEIGGRLYIVTCEDRLTNSEVREVTVTLYLDADTTPAELGGDNSLVMPSFDSVDVMTHATVIDEGDKTFCKGGLGAMWLDSSATNKIDTVDSAYVDSNATVCDLERTCNG